MTRSLTAAILTVALVCPGLVNRTQADSILLRAPLPPDRNLVDRLIITDHFRSDRIGMMRRSEEGQFSGAKGVSYRARSLSETGFFNRAAQILKTYFREAQPEDPLWADSLMLYIDITRVVPGLPVPFSPSLDERIPLRAADRFAAFLLDRGETARAANLIARRRKSGLEPTPLSVMTAAGIEASESGLDQSLSVLQGFRTPETSGATDLVYLMLGFTYLEVQDHRGSRQAFLAIPPDSPFAAEALFGLGWSLIRDDELTGAAVRLQELLDKHPYSPLSRQAALDLALIYRELGLYDNAAQIMKGEIRRIKEFRDWLRSLTGRDLRPGSDFSMILDSVARGESPPLEALNRVPSFIRAWLAEVAADRRIIRMTRLLKAADQMRGEIGKLEGVLRNALMLFDWEARWNDDRTREMGTIENSLQSAQLSLPSSREYLARSLEQASLERFANQRVIEILGRVSTIDRQLGSTQSDVSKVSSFSEVIEKIRDSSPDTEEGKALYRIRENAYTGLIESREKLTGLRSELKALEGRIWLLVKGEAVRYESRAGERITGQTTDAGRIKEKAGTVLDRLQDREIRLQGAISDVKADLNRMESPIKERLGDIRSRVLSQRTVRILHLAQKTSKNLDEAEALALFTAADIEIKRMDETLKALQEVVP